MKNLFLLLLCSCFFNKNVIVTIKGKGDSPSESKIYFDKKEKIKRTEFYYNKNLRHYVNFKYNGTEIDTVKGDDDDYCLSVERDINEFHFYYDPIRDSFNFKLKYPEIIHGHLIETSLFLNTKNIRKLQKGDTSLFLALDINDYGFMDRDFEEFCGIMGKNYLNYELKQVNGLPIIEKIELEEKTIIRNYTYNIEGLLINFEVLIKTSNSKPVIIYSSVFEYENL